MHTCVEDIQTPEILDNAAEVLPRTPPADVQTAPQPAAQAEQAQRKTANLARWFGFAKWSRISAFPPAMPINAIPGIADVQARKLVQFGIATAGALRRVPKPALQGVFGDTDGRHIWELARGRVVLPA
jgi:nucleotidyltransferase/DNA polymerase involved in DNA repair